MKCVKCGYVSFDYLSECKKCRTSLAALRESFGFSSANPAVPFLLGSLLRNYEPQAMQKSDIIEAEIPLTLDFGEPFDEEVGAAKSGGENSTGQLIPDPGEAEEDFTLLDLSDEELELLIDKDTFAPDGVKAQDHPGSDMKVSGRAPASAEPQMDGDLFQGLDWDEQFPDFKDNSPVIAEGPSEVKSPPDQAVQQPAESADEFVIEISENDLESLLKELDGTPKCETRGNGPAGCEKNFGKAQIG
jgi:hypothetical protein